MKIKKCHWKLIPGLDDIRNGKLIAWINYVIFSCFTKASSEQFPLPCETQKGTSQNQCLWLLYNDFDNGALVLGGIRQTSSFLTQLQYYPWAVKICSSPSRLNIKFHLEKWESFHIWTKLNQCELDACKRDAQRFPTSRTNKPFILRPKEKKQKWNSHFIN